MQFSPLILKIFLLIIGVGGVVSGTYAAFPVMPEIQAYHSWGTRNSNYSSIAAGISLFLSTNYASADRTLHILKITVPADVADVNMRVGGWFMDSEGNGVELGIHDQWHKSGETRGASLSLRHIRWDKTHIGASPLGKTTANMIHLGWSSGKTVMSFLFGIDFVSINTPNDSFAEAQFMAGARTAF
ncbi:MAG: hypothetical protein HQM12_11255 [SAR324 cluster bacterium]|nr:hypothetical protein [SAR324 cluster bacterium]